MKNKSLRFKISLYISLFSLLVLGTLWILQFVLLSPFHVRMEQNELARIGNSCIDHIKNGGSISDLNAHAFQHNITILSIDEQGYLLSHYYIFDIPVPVRQKFPPDEFSHILEKFAETNGNSIRYLLPEANGETQAEASQRAVFVTRLPEDIGGGYLYFSNTIPPISATVSVLRQQFLIISVVILLLGLIAAQWIARRLSRPITTLTESARQLAGGDLSTDFSKGTNGFAETQQLAQTLSFAAGELSRLEQYRRDLVANLSHDLKTPLTVIRMRSELIRDVCGDDKDARNRHCETIQRETDWLSAMVGEVLELSNLQNGSGEFEANDIDLSALAQEVLESFAPLEDSDDICFYAEIEDDLTVIGNAAGLRRVLVNLISNAVNHTGEDGAVGICLRREPEGVYFAVRDTGDGISPEELPNIWERYYKSGKTHKRAVTGTGLGLAIVREILARHGARYGVQSEIGKGSTFWVLVDDGIAN